MMTQKISFLFIFLLIVLSGCREDIIEETEITEIPEPEVLTNFTPRYESINGSVIGLVVDEFNNPVTNAAVTMDDHSTTTDVFGHFFFTNEELNAKGTLVRIKKDGYFDGSRRFFPSADVSNRVKIELLPKVFQHSFNSETGGTIELEGASIIFESNSIVGNENVSYDGTINVALQWLDPSVLETLDQMPGNLQGVNTLNEEVVLGTYGMLAVELRGENDEYLNIASDKTATIKVDVSSEMINSAPTEIPLWSYSEIHGLWVEESIATLVDGKYIGQVSHFSFWNYDAPAPFIDLSMTIHDENGNPFVNQLVLLTVEEFGSAGGITDTNGHINGMVPDNNVLLLEVLDVCGNVIYSTSVGPFTVATDIGLITVSNTYITTTNITGNIVCNGAPVENGVVIATFDGHSVYHYTNNDFEYTLITCPSTNTVELIGYDVDQLLQSEVRIATAGETSDIGTLNVCEEVLEEYLTVTLNDIETTYINPSVSSIDSIGYDITLISGAEVDVESVSISFNGLQEGLYDTETNFTMYILDPSSTTYGVLEFVDVTSYGAVGEYVEGSFSGTGIERINANGEVLGEYDVTGIFRVKRTE